MRSKSKSKPKKRDDYIKSLFSRKSNSIVPSNDELHELRTITLKNKPIAQNNSSFFIVYNRR